MAETCGAEADFAGQEQQSWEFDQTHPDADGNG